VRVAVPKETGAGERRVALVPDSVGRLTAAGFSVAVEQGAGAAAGFPDAEYAAAGADVAERGDLLAGAEAVVRVASPAAEEVAELASGVILIGFLSPLTDTAGVARLAERGIVAFAMESIPRITRAQSMDALSSQSTVAGYKAVVLAADRSPRLFPLLMTAAGTVAPAKVLVLGAGVAGLQAIATARRLGAVVSGFDVRPVVREQVESLGASFLDLGILGAETSGGYAAELTAEEQSRQQAALEERIPEYDGARAGPAGAAADPGGGRRADAARLGDRRPRRRDRRQLRADGARRRSGAARRHHRRFHRPRLTPALPRKPALLAQRDRAAAPPGARGRALARFRGRNHRRRLRHARASDRLVDAVLVFELTILVLAIFLGIEVISKVPTMLHTPLMSGTNAIHGIVLVGAILVAGRADADTLTMVVGFCAVVLGTANVVGGFVVTDRMLEMFKGRAPRKGER
jgi:NAD/NADP transhydrogenase alpha subunit